MYNDPVADRSPRPLDGRRQRTVDSRARIIAAMLELTEAGHIGVSAEMVAERANVGLRTVFRHFRDMESLYREMSVAIEARLRDEFSLGFASDNWRERLGQIIERRAAVFERIAPFKRAEAVLRHRSKWLDDDIVRFNRLLRDLLRAAAPVLLAQDHMTFEALDVLLSFETWDRLRREQGLGVEQAQALLIHSIASLTAGLPD